MGTDSISALLVTTSVIGGILAYRKGYSFWLFLFLAGVPAMIIVLLLNHRCPQCKVHLIRAQSGHLRCEKCGLETINGLIGETVIGASKKDILDTPSGSIALENAGKRWTCPSCKEENPNTDYTCGKCGMKLL